MWTVYKLTCNVNGKIYVGNTKNSLTQRVANGNGYKFQPTIYSDILLYGWNNFTKEVLATCKTLKESREIEAKFIEKFNCISPNGYNVLRGTFNICVDDWKLENIYQINKFGEIENKWEDISELKKAYCENTIRTIRSALFNAKNNKLTMCLGYFWILKEDLNKYQKEDYENHYKSNIKYSINTNNSNKVVYQYSPDGEFINSYKTRREVEKTNPIFKKTSVLRAIRSKSLYKGYFWSYKENFS